MAGVPLSVLDLAPSAEQTTERALHESIELARQAEFLGYRRYWRAERHSDVASPSARLALVASATHSLRLGSGPVLPGHQHGLATIQAVGRIGIKHPRRIDLALEISGATTAFADTSGAFPIDRLLRASRLALDRALRHDVPGRVEPVDELLALVRGTYPEARIEAWIVGNGGATVAGQHGLRFATEHRAGRIGAREALKDYRATFVPSAELAAPYAAVSADVLVDNEDLADTNVIPWPGLNRTPLAEALVGSPGTVAGGLTRLRDATAANELLIAIGSDNHTDRVRSYELLAHEWARR
jgi:alkanesulfonate monooxygenase SsuD/methylene tetrahydromethanopterin reductase-like flavin-dependent oxidoreductase (luciferase family)